MSPSKVLIAVAAVATLAGAGLANAQTPAPARAAPAASAARLNPNTATPAQLAAVPQLNPALIAAIQSQRPFKTTGDFNTLVRQTLTAEQAQALYPQLFLPINLNSATREEIALVPGMTPRMIREFLEYRPYTSIDQFNREIGKYVDQTELARLRSYVAL